MKQLQFWLVGLISTIIFLYMILTNNALAETIEDIFSLIFLIGCTWQVHIWYKMDKRFLPLFAGFCLICLCDLNYLICDNVLKLDQYSEYWNNTFYIPHLLSILCILYFFWDVVNLNITMPHKKATLWLLFVVDLTFIGVFLFDSHWSISFYSYLGIFNVITVFIDIFIFNLLVLSILPNKDKNTIMFLIGLMLYITYNIWIKYLFLNKMAQYFSYSIILEYCSVLLMFYTILRITLKGNINELLRKNNYNIKTQITLFIYLTLLLSFCILFFVAKQLTIINTGSIASFPLVLLIYSVLMIWIASTIGVIFSKQFSLLKNFINDVIDDNNFEDNYTFQIDEFDNLKGFIREQISKNKEASIYKEKINSYILTTVHNVRSPIEALNNIISSFKELVPTEELDLYNENIKVIQRKFGELLDYNKAIQKHYLDTSYVIINSIIISIVTRKLIEFTNLDISLNLTNKLLWGKFDSTELDNILSNLLNNSIEAKDPTRNLLIKINLYAMERSTTLEIIDNGKGFEKEKVPLIKQGHSFKENGNGIGIKSANDYLLMNNAVFDIDPEVGIGTTIRISFESPDQNFFGQDMPCLGQEVWIVDNDVRVVSQWKKYLESKGIKGKFYISLLDFEKHYRESHEKEDIFVIIDYNFKNETENGLSILSKHRVINAIVSTSDYTDLDLQNKIKKTSYKLYPKLFFKLFNI